MCDTLLVNRVSLGTGFPNTAVVCGNTYSSRTLSSTTFSFIAYFPDALGLVVIDFSANTDWTLNEALIRIVVFVNCIFCVASECAKI